MGQRKKSKVPSFFQRVILLADMTVRQARTEVERQQAQAVIKNMERLEKQAAFGSTVVLCAVAGVCACAGFLWAFRCVEMVVPMFGALGWAWAKLWRADAAVTRRLTQRQAVGLLILALVLGGSVIYRVVVYCQGLEIPYQ